MAKSTARVSLRTSEKQKPAKSLRAFLLDLEKNHPGHLLRITKPVNPASYEVTAILQQLEDRGKFPLVLFENPLDVYGKPSAFPLVTNVYASRERCAVALGLEPSSWRLPLSLCYAERVGRCLPVEKVAPDEAPVREVRLRGSEVDLGKFPIVRHHEMDPAPYIDMAPVMRHPEDGFYNAAFLRSMFKGPRKTTIGLRPGGHNWQIVRENDERKKPTPVIIVVSHHPAFFIGALNVAPFGMDDYQVIGSIMDSPLRVTPSETWGEEFMVPADAEIVIEGELPPGHLPESREIEAPFGEFTGYYGPQKLARIVNVSAVMHRSDAIFQDIFVGHRDNWVMGSFPKEGSLFHRLKGVIPTVKGVHFPTSGCGRFNCYISIDKKVEGESRQAAMVVLGDCDFVKNVVVVDGDIDPFNEEEVLWAVATRTQASDDIDIIRNAKGIPLDPSQRHDIMTDKLIIDATMPTDRPYHERLRVPPSALSATPVARFVVPRSLARIVGREES